MNVAPAVKPASLSFYSFEVVTCLFARCGGPGSLRDEPSTPVVGKQGSGWSEPISNQGRETMDTAVLTPPVMFGRDDHAGTMDLGIRDVAEMLGISIRAIRFYEQKGLFAPRRDGRFRVYNQTEIEQLRVVQNFRSIGLTIREIKLLLEELDRTAEDRKSVVTRRVLEKRLSEIALDVDALKQQETRIISQLGLSESSNETPAERVAC